MLVGLFSCATKRQGTPKPILGKWDNKSGQILDFKTNGKAHWIFYTEAKRDTFEIQYRTDFTKKPLEIDLTDFKVGPLKGRTLFGIIEFTDKNTIFLDFEPTQENRPKEFDNKQTQTYYRIE